MTRVLAVMERWSSGYWRRSSHVTADSAARDDDTELKYHSHVKQQQENRNSKEISALEPNKTAALFTQRDQQVPCEFSTDSLLAVLTDCRRLSEGASQRRKEIHVSLS